MASTEFCDNPSSAFRCVNEIFCPYASGIAKIKIASSNFTIPYCLRNDEMCTIKVNLTLIFKKQPHFVDFFTPGFPMNAPFLYKHENQTFHQIAFTKRLLL